MPKARFLPIVAAFVLAGCVSTTPAHSEIPAPVQKGDPVSKPIVTPTPKTIDKTLYSIDDPTSLWIVADKIRRLDPKKFAPSDLRTLDVPHTYTPMLRADAAKAYGKMYRAAKQKGISLVFQSGYRSYSAQVSVYNGWVATLGQRGADRQSARPGYSEHQTGLSVDIASATAGCTIQQCFATTPEGRWLKKHAWEYGWHLRYPKGKTDITGYKFEPWHYRYVGLELAAELNLTPGITLEEFFELDPAPDYAT